MRSPSSCGAARLGRSRRFLSQREGAAIKNSDEPEQIVITGCGWVTPFAAGTIETVLSAAIDAPARPAPSESFWGVPDRFLDDLPEASPEIKRDKGAWMAAAALEHACRDASLKSESLDEKHVGMVLGCSLAGQLGMIHFANEVRAQSPRFVSPIHFPQTVGNYVSGAIARAYHIRGPTITIACELASGLDAVVQGTKLILDGKANVVVAGGVEQLSRPLAEGLAASDLPGSEVQLSEGACLLVMERAEHAMARGARVIGSVIRSTTGPALSTLPRTSSEAIISAVGPGDVGSVVIEHWIGRCPAALGAAAIAAAIAAAGGAAVPVRSADDRGSISVRTVALSVSSCGEGSTPTLTYADAGGAHRTTLELVVPRT